MVYCIQPELFQLLNKSTNSINYELCDSYTTFANKDMLKFESSHVTDKIIAVKYHNTSVRDKC
jgi:hypothetical protein